METEFRQIGVRVGPARHGMGVFATRRLRGERELAKVEGEVIDDADYGSNHCMDLGGTLSLEPVAPFRFLNHSCEPNCSLILCETTHEDGSPATPEIWVETLRQIAPGEELTIDYAWPADSAIPCGCGAPTCRGWIVDPAELPVLQKKKASPRKKAPAADRASANGPAKKAKKANRKAAKKPAAKKPAAKKTVAKKTVAAKRTKKAKKKST